MKGVTIFTPEYRELAKEACRRWERFTGLPARAIERKRDGFLWKLRLDELEDGPCCFFDADWWLLREWKPEASGVLWQAVHDAMVWSDHTFAGADSERFHLERTRYFNSGLFICDLSRREHRKVFAMARETWQENKRSRLVRAMDWTDQFHLNHAVQRLHTPLSLLPTALNYFHFALQEGGLPHAPREVTGLHGAGIPLKDKLGMLRAQARVFGAPVMPMLPRAVAFHHDLQFNLR